MTTELIAQELEVREWSVSVRELVEFVWKAGDLSTGGRFGGMTRMADGAEIHREIQASRPKDYQPEVPIKSVIGRGSLHLTIRARIDGVLVRGADTILEEIKTYEGEWNFEADPVHWAQAKIYGYCYCRDNALDQVQLQLTYRNRDSGEDTFFRELFTCSELEEFYRSTVDLYCDWLCIQNDWLDRRDRSISQLVFPYGSYRCGQERMMELAAEVIENNGRGFFEAATGMGKTVSFLFPAIQSLLNRPQSKVIYLTAKNSGRAIVYKTLEALRAQGLNLRVVTLTAQERICFGEEQGCRSEGCSFRTGYFDRRLAAMTEGMNYENLDPERLRELGERHQVCPHALAHDLAPWADAVLCDYNYVFNPNSEAGICSGDRSKNCILLIDEAHNLVDRARAIYSAKLDTRTLEGAIGRKAKELTKITKAVGRIRNQLLKLTGVSNWHPQGGYIVGTEHLSKLEPRLDRLIESLEEWLTANPPSRQSEKLLEAYFELLQFRRIAGSLDESYRVVLSPIGRDYVLQILCIDPSRRIAEVTRQFQATLFFSGTLTPENYFKHCLGGQEDDRFISFPSPFPAENLQRTVITNINVRYRSRLASLPELVRAVQNHIERVEGNHLVFLPSFEYLELATPDVSKRFSNHNILVQEREMTDEARTAFVANFTNSNRRQTAGFCALGGSFAEGIDFERGVIQGITIVGIGLPSISLDRELIRELFDQQDNSGYDFAYTFPGLVRVMQAAGRLIRSEQDRGSLLLIDDRYRASIYKPIVSTQELTQTQ